MKIGFIGAGNMAGAMIGGILKNRLAEAKDIMASAPSEATREKVSEKFGIQVTGDNSSVAAFAEVLILAVKPIYMETVIREIAPSVSAEKIVVTLAPGRSLDWISDVFGKCVKLVRTMPNTPALVGEGMTGMCPNAAVTAEDLNKVTTILSSFGKVRQVSETLLDVVTGVSGSAPAYVFMFIEAMADAAVCDGMARKDAYEFAAQTVLGSAKMVLETGMHPGELKDMVCSPGGSTIEAVRVLEEKGLRSAVMEGQLACVKKARGL